MTQFSKLPQLAALIAAPQAGEVAMFNDMVAMAAALQSRGLAPDQICCLHGRVTKTAVLNFLHEVSSKIKEGTLFVHISGHGFFTGKTAETARPGLIFGDTHLLWDEFFAALVLPASVKMILLPDL